MTTSRFHIKGMDCAAEEQTIRNRLGKAREIKDLRFDVVNRVLTVDHEFESETEIRSLLADIQLPASETCDVGCAPVAADNRREDALLGVALVLAILAEVVAYRTGDERSVIVLAMSLAAIFLGGLETFKKGLVAVRTFTLNINFLMCIAVIGAFFIGSYPEAAMVIVLFAIAERIESLALDRARGAVRALMSLAPEMTFVNRDGQWLEVQASTVVKGEVCRVRPGDRIALDGEVVTGNGSVNQAPITGESVPVDKSPGDVVYAGTINGEGVLEFRVTGAKGSTTLDRIIQTVQEAQGSRAPTQRFIDSFARYYTPIVVVLALLVASIPSLLFGQPFMPWLYKALVLLVIACPCALVISTPVTVVSGLAAAARRGILIKGGAHLESGRKLTVIAVDKTGTLTHGEPRVTAVFPLHENSEASVRQIAATLDSTSAHPIAKAISAAWTGELLPLADFESLSGRGVTGLVGGQMYSLGNHLYIEELGICCDHVHDVLKGIEEKGQSLVILAGQKEALGVFSVVDTLREESREAIRSLHALGLRVLMLTGDNLATAQSIGHQVGVDDIRADMLPTQKLEAVEKLQAEGERVGMVGDGVNDAPALAVSSVGFAMGAAGTDAAIETADVSLMDDDLRKVPVYISLSRKTATILYQNIALSLVIKFVFFALAIGGQATLWMAVFADMGASMLVVANGLRLLRSR